MVKNMDPTLNNGGLYVSGAGGHTERWVTRIQVMQQEVSSVSGDLQAKYRSNDAYSSETSLVKSTRHAHLRDLLQLGLGQTKAQGWLRHEERILAQQ